MCDFLASYLPSLNVLGPRVSGYDDTSGYHSPANAADPPAASAEPPAAPGSSPAAAGPHASTGNCPLPAHPAPTTQFTVPLGPHSWTTEEFMWLAG